jgi:hypothetical protein
MPCRFFDSLLCGASGLSYKTSRLYRALVDGKVIAVDVSGWSNPRLTRILYRITITHHPRPET